MSESIVRRVSTSEAVVEYILTRIHQGQLGPRDWLPGERQLQEQLQIGRLSLREGLARLSALGIIRVDHGKGAQIQPQVSQKALGQVMVPFFADRDPKALADLLDAKGLIEGELAARTAERRSDEDIRGLATILDQPGEALTDDHALVKLLRTFHSDIARIADNSFLVVTLDAIVQQLRPFLLYFVRAHQDPQTVINRQRSMLEAIIEADPARARQCAHRSADVYKSSLSDFQQSRAGQGDP